MGSPGRPRISIATINEMQKLRNEGYKAKEIAAMYDVCLSTVYTYTVHPHRLLKMTKAQRDQAILEMRDCKVPWSEISRELCLCQNTLKRIFRKAKKEEENAKNSVLAGLQDQRPGGMP